LTEQISTLNSQILVLQESNVAREAAQQSASELQLHVGKVESEASQLRQALSAAQQQLEEIMQTHSQKEADLLKEYTVDKADHLAQLRVMRNMIAMFAGLTWNHQRDDIVKASLTDLAALKTDAESKVSLYSLRFT
jgi:uncharacterized membrane protein